MFSSILIILILLQDIDSDLVRLAPILLLLVYTISLVAFQTSDRNLVFAPNAALLLFVVVFPLQSFVILFFSAETRPLTYSLTFAVTYLCLIVVVAKKGVAFLLDSLLLACVVTACLAIGFQFNEFTDAMSATQTESGLARFQAFGAHPNLVGHNFAPAVALALCRALVSTRTAERGLWGACALVIFSLPLAASSRGAVVSLFASLIGTATVITLVPGLMSASQRQRTVLLGIGGLIIGAIVVLLNLEQLTQILDLDSEYRGLNSGMSGRDENWVGVMAVVFQSTQVTLLGAGLRSWSDALLGFATDSSYLNLLWEIGLPLTLLTIGTLLMYVRRLIQSLTYSYESIAALAIAIYMLVEGVVARYTLAIGNASSIVFLGLLAASCLTVMPTTTRRP